MEGSGEMRGRKEGGVKRRGREEGRKEGGSGEERG